MRPLTIGFVIPCLNEELTIGKVVADCRRALPESQVYVFDNKSTDNTAANAAAAGAKVIFSPRPGKGEVLRHAFACLEEDILITLDGDGTYPANLAPRMVKIMHEDQVDMLVVNRQANPGAYRRYHRFGNRFFSLIVSGLLRRKVGDVFSGYRAFSRDFYESVYFESKGFEIESELTLKAVSLGFQVQEIDGEYGGRPEGSRSKLSTFRDGFHILRFLFFVVKDCRPLEFFGLSALFCLMLSALAGSAPIVEFIEFHYVYALPRAILAASLAVLAFLFVGIGLVLDSQMRNLRAQTQLMRRWMRGEKKKDTVSIVRPGA